MKTSKLLLLLMIAALIAVFFIFDLQNHLTLDALKSQQTRMESYRSAHPVLAVAIYGLLYVAVTGLSLPGAAVLTLAGGAIFGLLWGDINRLVCFFHRRDAGVSDRPLFIPRCG